VMQPVSLSSLSEGVCVGELGTGVLTESKH
jgi:hypothetical protein